MIFSGDLCDKVLAGTKTQTRRPIKYDENGLAKPCQYRVGQTYAIQRKRGTHALGPRIFVTDVREALVVPITLDDAEAEGFTHPGAFYRQWEAFYGKGNRASCWRIKFTLQGSVPNLGKSAEVAKDRCSVDSPTSTRRSLSAPSSEPGGSVGGSPVSGAAKFRKKPVVIEAVQWDGQNRWEIVEFVGDALDEAWSVGGFCFINTLEGRMNADTGDWIIKGVQGEFYPCKPDIFEATYEPVEASDV